jgi:hypothetical protein
MWIARVILTAAFASFPAFCLSAQLLVLNKSDATLSFIDPTTGKTSATVPTGTVRTKWRSRVTASWRSSATMAHANPATRFQ